MHHEAMEILPRHAHHAVQDAALLEGVIGDIAVLAPQDRKAREQRVAVVPVHVRGIAPVGGLEGIAPAALAGQELVLRFLGPVRKARGMPLMAPLHLLQEHQIGVELMEAGAQLMDAADMTQAEELSAHALVDVVGGHAQLQGRGRGPPRPGRLSGRGRGARAHAGGLSGAAPPPARAGSSRMACAFDHEKQRSAACSQGSQA